METNKKIIGNAMIAYFLMFICLSFFLNKDNTAINNDFVKSHTKTAFLLHCLFLLVYILFVSFGIASSIPFLGFGLNVIISSGLFIILFGLLMYGMYKAHKGETFTIADMMTLTKTGSIIQVDEQKDLSEQDKFAIIISYIPFFGYITYGKYKKQAYIHDIVMVNLIASSVIAAFFMLGVSNVALLLTLLYTIFVAFSIVTLLGKDEVFHLDTSGFPTPTEKFLWQKSIVTYLISHLRNKKFTSISEVYQEYLSSYKAEEELRHKTQLKAKDIPLPPGLIYLPVINIVTFPFIRSRYHFHIINGLVLSILFITLALIFGFANMVPLVVLFPASFAVGYLDRLGYEIPYIYNIYDLIAGFLYKITHLFSKGREIQKKTETVKMKVGETKNSAPEKTQ